MLRLGRIVLTQLVSSSFASPFSQHHRLLSAAPAPAPCISPNPSFAVENYLVGTCGLTRAQALKASTKLSHIKSPTNPDAVLAFLAGLGFSTTDIAAVVAKDHKFLCAGVRRTLDPIFTGLTGLGLSQTEITRLVSVATASFRRKSILSNLPYYLSLFGSYENLLRALKNSGNTILSSDPERVVKPKVAVLTECGLGACDIAKLCIRVPRMLNSKPEYLQRMVACAEALGVPRGSAMFRHALQAVALRSAEKIASRVENLKSTFRWSDAEVRIAVSKSPSMLMRCKDNLQSRSEFLYSEVGLEPAYIAHRPILLNYSLEGRLRPRYYVVSFLKENGLLDHKRDYYAAVMLSEKVFLEKYIHPYKKTAPHLAKDYADACRGKVPTRLRVALTKDGQ